MISATFWDEIIPVIECSVSKDSAKMVPSIYGDSYLASSPSERNDNPSEQPAEGFIRIYFYSELLESETLYLHYWESASETETKIFATSWPGVEMIKYVE